MKNIMLSLPLVWLLCAFCHKEKNAEYEALLIDGDWIHTHYYIDTDNDGIFQDEALPCQVGDVWRFTADHKFQWRDELEYCDSDVDSVAVYQGTWELRNNNTELYLEFDPELLFYNFKIQQLSTTNLELRLYNDPSTFSPEEERLEFTR